MTIRETLEEQEEKTLSPYASLAAKSKGRDILEEPCDIRTVYQRDRDRILHSKSFRRLKHKTQVFLAPEGDHYRTRLTHTLEVAQIARTIARALRLNEDLTEAIALGHDLGHTPFGHAGEEALDSVCRDGILNHRTSGRPSTLEGQVVRLSDKIAYINHDIDDAIRAGLMEEYTLPREMTDVLGHSVRERLNTLIHDVIANSAGCAFVKMSGVMEEAMKDLRSYMFRNLYLNPLPKREDQKAKNLLIHLYQYYLDRPHELPDEYRLMKEQRGESTERVICDYIAGMSDGYAIAAFEELFIPHAWK